MEYLQFKDVRIRKTAALAPMAGVADYAYRTIAKEFGAALVFGEMVSSKGLYYQDKKSSILLKVSDEERPMAVQLFGAEPEAMALAAQKAEQFEPDFIDINSGCPVPKVVNTGAGSALMRTPELLVDIAKSVVEATKLPVSVKIRSGWDETCTNAVEIAGRLEQVGVSLITVHGRTKQQLYSGKADWDIIRAVKKAVNIPVIGNGDVDSVQSCIDMYEHTECDLVMIGRASYGNPWLFREINQYYETGEMPLEQPTMSEKLEVMERHIMLIVEDKGEYIGMKEARKIAGWYLKGMKGAAKFRHLCGQMSSLSDFHRLKESVEQQL